MSDPVPLRDHVERVINDYVRAHYKEHQLLAEANKLSEDTQRLWREAANEFRGQLKDQVAQFPTRAEVEVIIRALEQRLRSLEESRAKGEGLCRAQGWPC